MNSLTESRTTSPTNAFESSAPLWQSAESRRRRRGGVSALMMALCALGLVVAFVPLVMLLGELIVRGAPELTATFFTALPQSPSITQPNDIGGVSNAIIGSVALVVYASILAVPLGIAVGVYLTEATSKLSTAVRLICHTMAGAPSILMGLFAFVVFFQYSNVRYTAIAGAFGLSVLMIPVIALSSEIALRTVPQSLREAGEALAAKPSRIMLSIVLPHALPDVVGGVLLAVARAVGETAPILLVIGGGYKNTWGLFQPVSALPLTMFEGVKSQWPALRQQVWGIGLVLVVFVFVVSITARLWSSRATRS